MTEINDHVMVVMMKEQIMRVKILFFDTKSYDREFFEKLNTSFGFNITYIENHLAQNTVALTHDADVICVFVNDQITSEIVHKLYNNQVKLIALRSAGYNHVDLKAVYEKIHVVRVPAYSPQAVAEHTVALIMSLNRKTHRAYYRIRDNNFSIHGFLGFTMYGKTAGIIGTGKIGMATIDILKGFGMNVLAYDPYPNHQLAQEKKFAYVELNTIYSESDILSLHCPLTPENVHMINEKSLSKMKDTIMIINTGRGELIHTKDLIWALKNKKIGSAGLDVYEEETDYFFEDFSSSTITDDTLARLITFPNVLITSHQGFFTEEALNNIAKTTLENIHQFFEYNKLPNEICYKCCENSCNRHETGRCF